MTCLCAAFNYIATYTHAHSSQGHATHAIYITAPFSYIEFNHIHISQSSVQVNRIEGLTGVKYERDAINHMAT